MRATEFLTEAEVPRALVTALNKKGYKLLGKGIDQYAFLEPGTGMVLKIFGTNNTTGMSDQLTAAQKTFKLFADYSFANQNNEFLPNFTGWETFTFQGKIYLQIRMERLFPVPEHMAYVLENMVDSANTDWKNKKKKIMDKYVTDSGNYVSTEDYTGQAELLTYLGEEGFNKLWDTIFALSKLANDNNIYLDLHRHNFMLGSDGHIVISDPFFVGWGK